MSIKQFDLEQIAAEILAVAVRELFPTVQLVRGYVTPTGFSYDFIFETPPPFDLLTHIEQTMQSIINQNLEIKSLEMMRENAVELLKHHHQLKLAEIVSTLSDPIVQLIQIHRFYDLGFLPDISSTKIKMAYKLLSVKQEVVRISGLDSFEVTRIEGVVREEGKEVRKYLKQLEKAKSWDHREIGRSLKYFFLESEGYSWSPRGSIVREILMDFWRDSHWGSLVYTPKSEKSIATRHATLFKHGKHSYRELPLHFSECEEKRNLGCPSHLRGLIQAKSYVTDCEHIFCTPDQLLDILISSLHFITKTINIFGIESHWILCKRAEKFAGRLKNWDQVVSEMREAFASAAISFTEEEGRNSCKGPRLELQLFDRLGRAWTGPFLEVDFESPERLGVRYHGSDDEMHQPLMVKRSQFGSLERIVALLIEKTEGQLPLWIAPEQIRVIPVKESDHNYAVQVQEKIEARGFRCGIEWKSGKLSEKIFSTTKEKVPYLLILGDEERKREQLSVRKSEAQESRQMNIETFLDEVEREVEESRLKFEN